MELKAAVLAERVNGIIEGNPDVLLNAVAKIEEAQAGSLTFLANLDYEPHLYATRASAALVSQDFSPKQPLPDSLTLIRVEDPYGTLAEILTFAQAESQFAPGIHPTAFVHPKASVGEDCYIGAFTVIEEGASLGAGCQLHGHVGVGRNVHIGEGCTLYRGVQIMDGCHIGARCILQGGAIIGSDGFGFAPQQNNGYQKVPQIGNVVIGDQCEIGAATTIDRATMGSTVIETGVKLDNHIQVAHNVRIGSHTVIAAQTGIAGSTVIGSRCMIGGQVGFAGHIRVADGVKVAAQSGVTKSIHEADSVWQGTPALPIRDYQVQQITLRKLIRSLALQRIDALEKKLS